MDQSPPIKLPSAFCVNTIDSSSVQIYITACLEFLTSPLVRSLLECHPNDVVIDGPEAEWLPWWDWAAGGNDIWKCLVPGYQVDPPHYCNIPQPLNEMLHKIDSLTLPRELDIKFNLQTPSLRGMSPKKAHEVSQMTSFVSYVLNGGAHNINHIVDVGAGQGYLSRALTQPPLSMDVLALDFSEVQIKGFERRTNNIAKAQEKQEKRKLRELRPIKSIERDLSKDNPHLHYVGSDDGQKRRGSLSHQAILINPASLQESVTQWLSQTSTSSPIPVMITALHACGSLTPDIFRFFVENSRIAPDRSWLLLQLDVTQYSYGSIDYDYGMLTRGLFLVDFPLSKAVADANDELGTQLHLSYNHRSLASQSPLQWANNCSSKKIADLAIRKVVYRALLGKLIFSQTDPKSRESVRSIKIGRLPDSTYATFGNFLSEVERKLERSIIRDFENDVDIPLKSQLEVVHTLRSRIGPVIESLILMDRYLYLVENLPGRTIRMNNLFEQNLGSGRNVVLSVLP
ncbi:hypothetical protein Clacol_009910 [Clathrus columnatus]|uniref:Methyltransferase domain-containing protein n=1 Tax=Clathrus columnatus TaxID=1419009 RepID=A0AAV5ALT2_9AGAM|nr:hypothetical protein Clacol_009910 [Clathrus columnatus]